MALQIEAAWRPRQAYETYLPTHAGADVAIDEVATCTLRVCVNNRLMTKVVDDQQCPHDGPCVSAFKLAEWLLWNWWRIRWEPSRSERRLIPHDRQRHDVHGK